MPGRRVGTDADLLDVSRRSVLILRCGVVESAGARSTSMNTSASSACVLGALDELVEQHLAAEPVEPRFVGLTAHCWSDWPNEATSRVVAPLELGEDRHRFVGARSCERPAQPSPR